MKSFSFSVPQDIITGPGTLSKLPEKVKNLGAKKAMIISGPNLNKMGLVDKVASYIDEGGADFVKFTETEANPSVETVDKAVEEFKSSGADLIVAFGGGSPMDVAKAVAVCAKFGGSITSYEGAHKVPGKTIPVIAIPTTAGTGSEVTAFAVITDHSRNYKLTVFSYELIPQIAILDSELITTAPPSVAAACGLDAFVHAEEAYVSTDASPFTDAMALKAMELIGGNIRRFVADRTNIDAANAMITGSLFAGIAFSWARLGNVHAMSHPVSAYFNVAHGVANAILLPTIVEYNALADNGKYYDIFSCISRTPVKKEDFAPEMLALEIRKLNANLGIPKSLKEVGVTEDKFDAMADDAMKSGNILVNPRKSTKKDIIGLYEKAF